MQHVDEHRDRDRDLREGEADEAGVPWPLDQLSDAPWWALSAVLHLLIFLLIGGIVMTSGAPNDEPAAALGVRLIEPQKQPRPPTPKVNFIERPGPPKEVTMPGPPLKRPELSVEIPRGNPEVDIARPALTLSKSPHPNVIGIGKMGGAGYGIYSGRGRGGDGDGGTVSPIRLALWWLVRHQRPDGAWSCDAFTEQCDPAAGPCKNAPAHPSPFGGDGRGGSQHHTIGVTSLAVLAFTGFGYTHRAGSERAFVLALRKACRYLKSVQIAGTGDPRYDGCFRQRDAIPSEPAKETAGDEETAWMYDHALATMAMAELLVLSGDVIELGPSVEAAADFCLRAQADGSGWRYSVKSPVSDTSITGWMVLALKTVAICRELDFIGRPATAELTRSFAGALAWFDAVTSGESGVTGYRAPGDQGSMLIDLANLSGGYPFSKEPSCMTAVAVLCRIFAGENRTSSAVKRGVAVLLRHPPLWRTRAGKALSTINYYYWYYASLAMFQYGGSAWAAWERPLRTALLASQRTHENGTPEDACEFGSWDPIDEWSQVGGRVYATAMGALTLEVYSRYLRLEGKPGAAAAPVAQAMHQKFSPSR